MKVIQWPLFTMIGMFLHFMNAPMSSAHLGQCGWRTVGVGYGALFPVIQIDYVNKSLLCTNCNFSTLCAYPYKSLLDYVMNLLISFKISTPVVLVGKDWQNKRSPWSQYLAHI